MQSLSDPFDLSIKIWFEERTSSTWSQWRRILRASKNAEKNAFLFKALYSFSFAVIQVSDLIDIMPNFNDTCLLIGLLRINKS